MRFADLDDLPAKDPLPAENAMLADLARSLRDISASIANLHSRQATLLVAALEVAELQTSRLPEDRRRRERDIPMRNAAAEIAAALRVSDHVVQRKMSDAWTLFHQFFGTFTALAEGRISPAHVDVILSAGAQIDDPDARATFEQMALDRAQIETAGRLRTIIGAIAETAMPTSTTERHREARKKRGVFLRDTADGMADLLFVGPAVLAHGIYDRCTEMARAMRAAADVVDDASNDDSPACASSAFRTDEGAGAGTRARARARGASTADALPADTRTMDQLRADVLADIALNGAPMAAGDGLAGIKAHVQVIVPVLTLAGVHDRGAELVGASPIDADTARRLAGAATGWDRVMTHPVTGAVLAVDRYRPNGDLRRTLRVRDEHCRFPGCRMATWRCDIDHSHDAALGGATEHENLAHLCRRHHTLKHARGWKITHLGSGTLEWASPGGQTYIDVPTPTLRFVPSTDPPPF
ncbi:DUF222 domain-containing protein [Microbacterium sp. NPDC076911]|uniref:HNH endonuclease signature motif containing protein n=1 Tax=Microbacterium sp. NPDC076911 TaxID=3154958 RepID=UPI00342AFA81